MSVARDRIWAVTIVVLLVMVLPGCLQPPQRLPNTAFPNEPDGFRGIKWGTKITRLSGMEFVRSEGAEKYYIRPDDKLKVGEAVVERITYGFYRDEFFKVTIYVKGLKNYLDLKQTFSGVYGEGDNVFGKDFYTWPGKQVFITIEFKGMLNEGEAIYTYKPIMEKMSKETGGKSAKGAGDL
ncbi:MAG: hypothetical protein NTV99_10685 [Deltaproteobacteria bacterium]|nr:hypothetical protein [Deltaproteobacteria bacterium]